MSFESVRLLLQREDQPAALAALRDHLEECPNDVDPPGVPKADDLVTALTAADWDVTVDEHGDIVGLRYLVDKAPRDSTETFPYYLLYALAPYIRYGKFARWEEQDAGLSLFVVGRRERLREIHHRRAARLVQLGGPSTVSGGAAGFRFMADELPGYERYFWGLFAALEGSYAGESGFRLAFADDPGTWVEYASYYRSGCYEWGQPWRWLVPRR